VLHIVRIKSQKDTEDFQRHEAERRQSGN